MCRMAAEIAHTLVLLDPEAGTWERADPLAPQLRVDDLAPHRGDGIFETVLVSNADGRGPQAHARAAHLERFGQSARMLDLPAPDPEVWDAALDAASADFAAANPDIELFSVRYALSRGLDRPAGWVLTIPIEEKYPRQRREGVRVRSADRGYEAYFGQSAPWALIGAKTLSYATNMASGRWAQANGADEVLYFSHDGIALEGPSSNLIIRRGDELITPDPKAGLLHGTTQRTLFERAAEAGFLCSYQDLCAQDVAAADAAWMVSSVRMAVPIIAFDDTELTHDAGFTERMHGWVLASS